MDRKEETVSEVAALLAHSQEIHEEITASGGNLTFQSQSVTKIGHPPSSPRSTIVKEGACCYGCGDLYIFPTASCPGFVALGVDNLGHTIRRG